MIHFDEDAEYDADTGVPFVDQAIADTPPPESAPAEAEGPKYSEYQVSDDFPPDKEGTWPYPQEYAGWVLAHDSLRGELEDIRVALTTVKGRELKQWEVMAIKRFMAVHFLHTHGHHHNEDVIMVPFLKERFTYPEKLEADHGVLDKKMQVVQGLIEDLKEGATVDTLLEEWIDYENMSKAHLLEEEETALPMMRAFFTAAEEAPKVQEIMQHAPKVEIGAFIYYQGVDRFRTVFMPQEGIPSFVWMIDFKGRYKAFIREFKEPLDSLKSGVPHRPTFFQKVFKSNAGVAQTV